MRKMLWSSCIDPARRAITSFDLWVPAGAQQHLLTYHPMDQDNTPALQDLLILTPSSDSRGVLWGAITDHPKKQSTKTPVPSSPQLFSLPFHGSQLFCCVYTQKTRSCPLSSSIHDTSNYPASEYPIWLLVFSFFFFFFFLPPLGCFCFPPPPFSALQPMCKSSRGAFIKGKAPRQQLPSQTALVLLFDEFSI